jgi:hypothetical protein
LLKEVVLSFDHNDPSKRKPHLKRNWKIFLIQENVPVLGLGIIENGKLKQIKF